MSRKMRTASSVIGSVLLLGALGCRDAAPEEPKWSEIPRIQKPNVLIWLVDTLRADHLGLHGYPRNTSPRLDRFAKDAVVFENAYAPSSWTKPSTASLLTGVNPNVHGAVGYYGLLSGARLIGEYLKPIGYQTSAWAANLWIDADWGFAPGFDLFNRTKLKMGGARAHTVAAAVLAYLGEQATQPFCCYVHVLDPHEGYAPPAPYDTMWGRRLPRRATMARYMKDPPAHVVEDMIKGYDGEITFSDHHFGRVLDHLTERGLYNDCLIVFTSDHGEEFFEHGHGGHGRTLHQPLVRVPLIVKFPGNAQAGRRVKTRASLNDVVPTILSYLGVEHGGGLDGVDLVKTLEGAKPTGSERPFFMQTDHVLGEFKPPERSVFNGVLLGRYKYVEQFQPQKGRMLFDVVADPDENKNLLTDDPKAGNALAKLLDTYMAQSESGIHFRNVNAIEKSAKPNTFRVVFRTEGRFVRLERQQFEKGDLADIRDDGKTLHFAVRGVNVSRSKRLRSNNWWLVDEDSIRFDVEPLDAKIVLESYACKTLPDAAVHAGSAKTPINTLPYTFTTASKALTARNPARLLKTGQDFSVTGPAGAYLAVVPTRAKVDRTELDQETRDKLRSLGYVGN